MPKRKWLKRLLLVVAIVMVVALGTVLVLWHMVRSQPDFYRIVALPREQIEAAAQSATNKFAAIQNQAARIHAGAPAASAAPSAAPGGAVGPGGAGAPLSPSVPTPSSPGAITVTFTDTELNAFFEKWSIFQNWKAGYDRHLADPVLILKNGRVILAARLKELDLIASLHFEPTITPDGKLDLQLVQVLGGNLPLPESFVAGYERKITDALRRNLPAWQRAAAFDGNGAANRQLIAASMSRLCIRTLEHKPSDAVLFLPIFAQRGSVPVRLTQVKIDNGSMTLTVEPMNQAQRAVLLEHVKNGERADP